MLPIIKMDSELRLTHYMPGRNLRALWPLSHLILTSSPRDWHYYKPHFTDDKTEA